VRRQRLHRAFRRLASPGTAPFRLVDIAFDYKFASDTFVRAVRRQCGVTQGEVRRLSQLQRDLDGGNGSEYSDTLNLLKNFPRGPRAG
jgi:AraC-like DNA-binding protein